MSILDRLVNAIVNFGLPSELLPLLSCGLSFIVCIPTAFVSLSESAVQRATPRSRARVLAAGCFHNFILWTVFSLVSQIGVLATFGSLIGYKDISNVGKGVINVDPVGFVLLCLNS